jgi:hypothetical protein
LQKRIVFAPDDRTERLTVINSEYREIESKAQTTTEMQTEPEDDPVQYVRQQFLSILGRQPDPAAHFYWSDLLIRCGGNSDCLNQQRAALTEYLESGPQPQFSISGNVLDENGNPLPAATITLTGSQSASRSPTSSVISVFLTCPQRVRIQLRRARVTTVSHPPVRPLSVRRATLKRCSTPR